MSNNENFDERILILAPLGCDAVSVLSVLEKEGIHGEICQTIEDLCVKIHSGAGGALITEEALSGQNVWKLKDCLQGQEKWSDLPIVILTSGGETTQAELRTLRMFSPIGNVSLLERPLRIITLVTTIQVALRSRRRQYGVRSLLLQQIQARETEENARREAERLNRIKDDFLSTLSHELRTPLTPLIGWTRLLMSGTLEKTDHARALATIQRCVQAQTQLIEDLLDISRIITGKMRLNITTTNVNKVLETALDVCQSAADAKGVELIVSMPPTSVPMKGDEDRLQQIFWNLLTNAVKFTPQGGTIRTTLGVIEGPAGTHIEVVVSDTGVGIAADFLPIIFERFTQAESAITRSYGGLGIGLSIVRSLVELHGGTLMAESAGKDKGSTFTVRFPVRAHFAQEPDAPRLRREESLINVALLDRVKILLVDDEPQTREVLSVILRQSGALVISAGSVREALEKYIELKPDIVISDLGMPTEDGYELVRRVRVMGEKTPMIALTAYAREEDRRRCVSAGFQRHVTKPVDPPRLVSAINEVLQQAT